MQYQGNTTEALLGACFQVQREAPWRGILSQLKSQGVEKNTILSAWMNGREGDLAQGDDQAKLLDLNPRS